MVLYDFGRLEMEGYCAIGAFSNVLVGMLRRRVGFISPFAVIHEMNVEEIGKIQCGCDVGAHIAEDVV